MGPTRAQGSPPKGSALEFTGTSVAIPETLLIGLGSFGPLVFSTKVEYFELYRRGSGTSPCHMRGWRNLHPAILHNRMHVAVIQDSVAIRWSQRLETDAAQQLLASLCFSDKVIAEASKLQQSL